MFEHVCSSAGVVVHGWAWLYTVGCGCTQSAFNSLHSRLEFKSA